MVKLTALFGHPESPEDFERHYLGVHVPLAKAIPHVTRIETARVGPSPSGETPPYYRMAELWFPDLASLDAAMASPQGRSAAADIATFATGGATLLVSAVDGD
ncbi:EthD family reductase [Pseudonocardia sp. C8]|uniref:EthD family reductase n=1 Tax=Pseudonocardia sp. C8 TaxID=2762759 RepID=UPI0016431E10|nr:EthD family reductase [Pseudonocardia sp. C8]MBC3193748.1 EthD family reductase [Pseudonocardia sp. C8]